MKNLQRLSWLGVAIVLLACAPAPVEVTQTPTAAPVTPRPLQTIPIVVPTPNELARANDVNDVSVEIVPLNLYDAAAEVLEFEAVFSTHAVDLNYDFAALATLQSDTGEKASALKWDGSIGGHHVVGVLSFPALKTRGQTITLVLRGIADAPERAFEWPSQP